ncbi:MAG: DUF3300 domain-containing protein [Alphaproteobacteria bacterium]|nr:DUF3300 domain-containing protein [Alphaproteobacteria bacterium]
MKRRQLLIGSGAAVAMVIGSHGLRAQDANKPFTSEQLDQMLAPIALYPDALLAQVLMAATYPLEVVEAARWSQAHPTLKGDQAVQAVKDQSWDVSVKSLTAFPQTLEMMSNKLDWTQRIGDAMIGQQKEVADSIQRLRAKAAAAGNLKSTPQQKVTTQAAPSGGSSAIVIEPANPETIYVPYYNPNVVYGTWPYPAYPPYYYPPPPNYAAATAMTGLLMFGLGVAAGAAMFGGWHWGWSGSGWGNSYTSVNVNKAVNISANNFDANRYRDGQWQFDPAHRDGVPYRTEAERQQYNQVRPDAQQREQFRGQLENRNQANQEANRQAARNDVANRENRPAEPQRPAESRPAEPRPAQSSAWRGDEGRGTSAFQGIERGGDVNRDYDRGSQSWGNRSFSGGSFGGHPGGFRR